MKLPIKTFWLLSSSIERIEAQKDMRALTVAVSGQSDEAANGHRERLILEIGTVVTADEPVSNPMEAERDQAGFEELKAMAQQK